LTFFDLITWDSLVVWAWNLVCGRFMNFQNGRKILTLLTFGWPINQCLAIFFCPLAQVWWCNLRLTKSFEIHLVLNMSTEWLLQMCKNNGLVKSSKHRRICFV